jgi:uncharacterized protein (TIGR03000 family)
MTRSILTGCTALALLLASANPARAQYRAPPRPGFQPATASAGFVPQFPAHSGFGQHHQFGSPFFYGPFYGGFYPYGGYGYGGTYINVTNGGINLNARQEDAPYYPPRQLNSGTGTLPPIEIGPPPGKAELTVQVPADAVVTLEGRPTKQTGPVRKFVTPQLDPGVEYVYTIKATWTANGKPVEETMKVTVKAGDAKSVAFLNVAAAPGQAKKN